MSPHIYSIFDFFYIVSKCAEASILCESKKVKGLRRERHHLPVCVFLWWTINQQRRAVIVLQEAATLYKFYYILLASTVAAQGFLSVAEMHTGECIY